MRKNNNYQFEEEENNNMNKSILNRWLVGIALLFATVFAVIAFEFVHIKGNELGVKETWTDGVVNEVLTPKNYILFPGWSQKVYTYDATLQKSTPYPYEVKSSDNQRIDITSYTQWRINPTNLVVLHKTIGHNIEEKVIKPALTRALLTHATKFKAIEAYSGEGLVRLQNEIFNDLTSNPNVQASGIIIEGFVVQHVSLDNNYVGEIDKRQLATLRQTRAVEEQKAAEAEALVAKSKAQADLNTKVVEAERDQQVKIIAAKAESEQTVIAAKAAAERVKAEADAKKYSSLAEAEGLIKLGEAKATSLKLQLQSYSVPGSEQYTRIEVSKNLSEAYKNIKGYLPSDLKVNLLTDSFEKSIDILTGNAIIQTNLTHK